MQNRHSEAAHHLSKLISAIRKQWREELGGSEAPATESALRNVQDLLTAVRDGSIMSLLAQDSIARHLGEDWLACNPWAQPHVRKIEMAIFRSTEPA